MSNSGQDQVADAIRKALEDLGLPAPSKIVVQKIPFSGMWGWGCPAAFQIASARRGDKSTPVNLRAQEIAEAVAARLEASGQFHKVEAVKGYVNVFFETGSVANDLLRKVFLEGERFGRGASRGERVMIEYSQPNTHKAFHVGHLRNVCLGHSLAKILDFAGFETLTANYPGDIGLHVIKCLWCYLKFHEGKEPAEGKGRWLGEIYAQADSLLRQADEYRDRAVEFLAGLLQPQTARDVRKPFSELFFKHVQQGLERHRQDAEFGADLTTLLQRIWLDEPPQFKEFAHRRIGEWMWELWDATQAWFDDQAAQTDDEGRREAWRQLAERRSAIGNRRESWFYAREIRELFASWERQDPALIELWKRTRQWSLDDFDRIYNQLGAEFEVWFYEHEVEDEGKDIVEQLIAQGVATDLRPHGPVLVDIDKQLGRQKPEYRTLVILRSDGTSLYSTKDLALARRKFEEYGVDRSIYVVDVGQALYFQQIFKVLELWGFKQARKCFHLAYEVVRLPSGKMSSREGSVVFYDDFFAEALRRARESVNQKRSEEQHSELPDLNKDQRDEVALAVAMGAMKYGMLNVDNNKPITFDFDAALSFEGQTAPYIQYAHARACRILEKAGGAPQQFDYSAARLESSEVNLLEVIDSFGREVDRAAREYKPLLIAVYLFNLAKSFNDFYRDCPVLRAEAAVRENRLALVDAARRTLANGLALLGIPAPRYM